MRRAATVTAVVLVIAACAALGYSLGRNHQPTTVAASPHAETVSATPSSPAPTQTTPTTPPPSTPRAPTSAIPPTPFPPGVSGDALARNWLATYLTRTTPTDNSWQAAIAPVTDPALITTLAANGDRALAITDLTSWHVTSLTKREAAGIDTPSRQMSSWLVTISDGTHHATRTIDLIAYVDDHNTWIVSQADIGYTSGG